MDGFDPIDEFTSVLTPVNTMGYYLKGKTNWYKFTTSDDQSSHDLKIATCTPETTFATSNMVLYEDNVTGDVMPHSLAIDRLPTMANINAMAIREWFSPTVLHQTLLTMLVFQMNLTLILATTVTPRGITKSNSRGCKRKENGVVLCASFWRL